VTVKEAEVSDLLLTRPSSGLHKLSRFLCQKARQLATRAVGGVKSRKNQSIRNTRCQPLAKYKAVFSSNLGVDNSALKSWVNVFSSVFSPKTNIILFRLLCKLTNLPARSVEQEL